VIFQVISNHIKKKQNIHSYGTFYLLQRYVSLKPPPTFVFHIQGNSNSTLTIGFSDTYPRTKSTFCCTTFRLSAVIINFLFSYGRSVISWLSVYRKFY